MELFELVSASIADTKRSLWPTFGPELALCGTVLVMLLLRLTRLTSKLSSFWVALAGALVALYLADPGRALSADATLGREEFFTGMIVIDAFSVFVRSLLILFLILFAVFTRLSGIPDSQDSPDFYCMVIGGILGMCLMASANHLLVVFLAVEMASVPSYALAAMLKGRPKASEAALKYAVFGAGAAGVMLYGISLLAGITHSAHLPTIAGELSQRLPMMGGPERMVLALSGLMIGVGLFFKLSAVPFHFWCPDVFEGASAEVNAYLSVASKAGALALLVRVCLGVGLVPTPSASPLADHGSPPRMASLSRAEILDQATGVFAVADEAPSGSEAGETAQPPSDGLQTARMYMAWLLGFVAAVTMTFGNLAAYGQTNIKRLFAYSTIAHAGYMMLPVAVALVTAVTYPEIARRAIAALAIYMGLYLFMNLGAFALVAFLRNRLGSEEISAYAGLVHRHPGVVICFSIVLFSLIGMPPLAGFVGKFAIFASVAQGYQQTGQGFLLALLVLGGINTVLSLFYYLRVVKVMAIDSEPDEARDLNWSLVSVSGGFVALITLPLVALFFGWGALDEWARAASYHLF